MDMDFVNRTALGSYLAGRPTMFAPTTAAHTTNPLGIFSTVCASTATTMATTSMAGVDVVEMLNAHTQAGEIVDDMSVCVYLL